jgi:3',5'-cyclic AMP phosphodiesterase CpdA
MIVINRRIAVVSDIHIGPASRSGDLCPPARAKKHDEQFTAEFERFVTAKQIEANHLIVSGDISSKAAADEFVLAASLVLG